MASDLASHPLQMGIGQGRSQFCLSSESLLCVSAFHSSRPNRMIILPLPLHARISFVGNCIHSDCSDAGIDSRWLKRISCQTDCCDVFRQSSKLGVTESY